MDAKNFVHSLGLTQAQYKKLYDNMWKFYSVKARSIYDGLTSSACQRGPRQPTEKDVVNQFLIKQLNHPDTQLDVEYLFVQAGAPESIVHRIRCFQPKLPANPQHGLENFELQLQAARDQVEIKIEKANNEKRELEEKIQEMKREYAQMVQYADPYAKVEKHREILDPQKVKENFQRFKEYTQKQKKHFADFADAFKVCYKAANEYKEEKLRAVEGTMKRVLSQQLGAAVKDQVNISTSLETALLKELNLQDMTPYVSDIYEKYIKKKQLVLRKEDLHGLIQLAWAIVLQRPEMKVTFTGGGDLFEGGSGGVLWPALIVEGDETIRGLCA